MNLREQAEADTAITLEGDWGVSVTITNRDIPAQTQTLLGQVLYDYEGFDLEGNPTIINRPIVSLRISSLANEPQDGEVWYFDIPAEAATGAPIKRYVFEGDASRKGFKSIGVVSFPLSDYEDLT